MHSFYHVFQSIVLQFIYAFEHILLFASIYINSCMSHMKFNLHSFQSIILFEIFTSLNKAKIHNLSNVLLDILLKALHFRLFNKNYRRFLANGLGTKVPCYCYVNQVRILFIITLFIIVIII